MALIPDNVPTALDGDDIDARFGIAQDGTPTEAQWREQSLLRASIVRVAQDINANIADSRAKSMALTHLEDALMWAGKAIFQREGVI